VLGSKTLSTIREELRAALAATGDDPIRWLEERMAAPGRQESEVLHSLRRVLEAAGQDRPRKQRAGTKK
jgi:hypothetical protein